MASRIIALFGKKKSGKNYLAQRIATNASGKVLTAFAAPIKDIAAKIFSLPDSLVWGESHLRDVYPIEWERNPKTFWDTAFWKAALLPNTEHNRALREIIEELFNNTVKVQSSPLPPYKHYSQSSITTRDILKAIGQGMRVRFGNDYWLEKTRSFIETSQGPVIVTDGRLPHEFEYCKKLAASTILIKGDEEVVDNHETEKLPFKESDFDFFIDNCKQNWGKFPATVADLNKKLGF